DRRMESVVAKVSFDPFSYVRRSSQKMTIQNIALGGEELVRVVVREATYNKVAHKLPQMGDYQPEIVYEKAGIIELDPRDEAEIAHINQLTEPQLVTVRDGLEIPVIAAFRLLAARIEAKHPILLKDILSPIPHSEIPNPQFTDSLLTAATNMGSLLCDGIGDAILIQGEDAPGQSLRLAYNILQAAGCRIFKTDYVACPSCGRTLFNLQETTARIKASTLHLKGVKIAIMGCIVNGPGEMADADFGYVGGAPGKVNLYVGKTAVKFNIPEAEAVERLKDLIREHGKWVDPAPEITDAVNV
ncbi:MAG: flavodoxin-dependent (E)-4-hydroxy-3-methylbut-2-enyl-diphosphate synthase, partial [Chthoniobacterales bacterium]